MRLGQMLLFGREPGISIAQNPCIEFTFLARSSGDLQLLWKDDQGQMLGAQKTISIA